MRDEGDWLLASGANPQVVALLVEAAKAKEWKAVRIWGDAEFVLEARKQFEAAGIPVTVADDPKRERREYLHMQKKTGGGVQRFKAGHHGAAFELGALIGYVQEGTVDGWYETLNRWVRVLVRSKILGWTPAESLRPISPGPAAGTARSHSANERPGSTPITLHHLWIEM